MADETETSGNTNFAHIPGAGVSPVSTHGKPTGGSTLSEELAGTSTVSGLPGAINIVHPTVGEMSNPNLEANPSGCKVTPFSPSGTHDVDSSGRPA